MAEATDEPRLSPELRAEDEAIRQSNVRDVAKGLPPQDTPPGFDEFNAGNFFDPLAGGMPAFSEPEAPWWAVTDDESPYYDLYNPGGVSEASSVVGVVPGASIGMTTNVFDTTTRGSGHPGDSARFGGERPYDVDPMKPQSLRSVHEQYWRMSPKQRAEWQQRMYDAGFLKEEPPVWGQPDPRGTDFAGWAEMAKMAARLNIPMLELANQMAGAGMGDSLRGSDPARRRPDITLTNAADARRMAEAIGVELMGRAPTDEEKARAVARLHALERSGGNRRADAAVDPDGGAVVEGTVSAQTAIEDALEADNPEEVRGHDTAEQFASFLGMLGGQ